VIVVSLTTLVVLIVWALIAILRLTAHTLQYKTFDLDIKETKLYKQTIKYYDKLYKETIKYYKAVKARLDKIK